MRSIFSARGTLIHSQTPNTFLGVLVCVRCAFSVRDRVSEEKKTFTNEQYFTDSVSQLWLISFIMLVKYDPANATVIPQ